METMSSFMHRRGIIEIKYCQTDLLFYIYLNSEVIHTQPDHPTLDDINDAAASDDWDRIIQWAKNGYRVRCSHRMYYHFLEVLPPLAFNSQSFSFYCSEPVRNTDEGITLYYYLETLLGKHFISLKPIDQ